MWKDVTLIIDADNEEEARKHAGSMFQDYLNEHPDLDYFHEDKAEPFKIVNFRSAEGVAQMDEFLGTAKKNKTAALNFIRKALPKFTNKEALCVDCKKKVGNEEVRAYELRRQMALVGTTADVSTDALWVEGYGEVDNEEDFKTATDGFSGPASRNYWIVTTGFHW